MQLKQFAEPYCHTVGERVDDEEGKNYKSKNKNVKCVTPFTGETERIFQQCYTCQHGKSRA